MSQPSIDGKVIPGAGPEPSSEMVSLSSQDKLELGGVDDTVDTETDELKEDSAPERQSIEILLDRVAGTEEKRFLIGSVFIPLLIAAFTITIGAEIASDYQDWQDRRSRGRDIVENMREAATTLSQDLEALAQKGGALERIWSNQGILDEVQAVEGSLGRLRGMNSLLTNDAALQGSGVRVDLAGTLGRCEQAVADYTDCLSRRLSTPDRGESVCTAPFRRNLAAEGSCKSLEAEAYSILY